MQGFGANACGHTDSFAQVRKIEHGAEYPCIERTAKGCVDGITDSENTTYVQ